ncbi:hypothetical protein, partial [Oleiphilus sp. HI0123]|uniref:hypothetical protein n=1 Tax=Oleiphilus sp. HI0123 TaxID=1822265 RepID=UPI001E637B09
HSFGTWGVIMSMYIKGKVVSHNVRAYFYILSTLCGFVSNISNIPIHITILKFKVLKGSIQAFWYRIILNSLGVFVLVVKYCVFLRK